LRAAEPIRLPVFSKEFVVKVYFAGAVRLILPVLITVPVICGSVSAISINESDLVVDHRIDNLDLKVLAENWLVDCTLNDCNGADIDDNNNVDFYDYDLLADYWLQAYPVARSACDVVQDCHIDWKDFSVFVDRWLADCCSVDCNGLDFNNNYTVDFVDFALFAQHFGSKPDFECLWGIVQQRLDTTMNALQTNPIYIDANYPRSTDANGEWKPKSKGTWGHWACGFLPGALWYVYKETGEQKWKDWAIDWTMPLENNRNRIKDHESGFIVYRSFGFDYFVTGDANCIPVILDATASMLTRFDADVGCIRSWNSYTYPVITDGMMMLDMVFWAVKNGGDPNWYDMAVSHANKTMQNNVRANGSCWQIVDYYPDGTIKGKHNKQGYNDDSTWSRGQAWGIAGFAMAYRRTGDVNYLGISKKMADWFIDNLPPDYVPYWDFNAPNIPDEPKDTSAAAIAASGMLQLSELAPLQQDKEKYYDAACNILDSLASPAYLAAEPNMNILLHGTGRANPTSGTPDTWEIDCGLIYGDHFFIEALLRKEGIKIE